MQHQSQTSDYRPLTTLGLLLASVLLSLPCGAQQAQDPRQVAAQFEQSRKVNEAKREATIAAHVAFTLEEKSAFWPIYWEYRGKVNEVDDAYLRIIDEYASRYQAMDDRSARRIVDEWLKVQADWHGLKAEYIKRFQTVLPPAKVLRVFQIENKLDVLINADLSKRLPLSEPQS